MNITINNRRENLPDNIANVSDLVKHLHLNEQGTAVAVAQRLVSRDKWEITRLKEDDNVTVISAAFGG